DFDLLVIGSGPAGEKGAAQAAYFDKRVAVIEKAAEPGGAGVHTGTLPSKTLREAALFLSGYRQRELYGVSVSVDPVLAVPKLLSRKNTVRGQEVERVRWNLGRHKVTYVHGSARLVDAHTVEVSSEREAPRRMSAEFILLAPGSVPHHPDHIPFSDPDVDDSDTILRIDRMPSRLLVVGGGVIGCEYASMFAALGVKVTLVEPRTELLAFLDADMSAALGRAFVAAGMDLRLGACVKSVRRYGEHLEVTLESGDTVACDKLLYAAGRSGATAGLGLEEVGVELGKRGVVVVDEAFRTRVPSIYAAGDVIGFPALASTSMDQARVAVCHAFGFGYKRQVSALLPYGIYTIPEISCVGWSEEDARAAGMDVVCGSALYRHNARAKILGDPDGLVKLVFERATRKLVGAHVLGDRATELVHIGQAVIALGGTVDTLIEMVFNYPTLAECFKYAAYDALGRFAR
ncbi:MAG: Si-specific NAD(P)(+) transhydrogenase, partial [Polyangiaceae bacterium]|nr:Si-specific NAD(P)(+) transhydrogenase [Polyangiaceae bacterium]